MGNKAVILLVISLSIFACNFASRQPRQWSPKDMAERQTQMMNEQLNLSEQQLKQVESINLNMAKEFENLRNESDGDREKMRILRNDLMTRKNQKLEEVLTTEQFERYLMLEEERAKEMRNGRRGERGRR